MRHTPAALLVLFMAATHAPADQVFMKDGRSFEGTVVHMGSDKVVIDAMVATIRTKLSLPADDVKSIRKAAVPEGFYQGPAPAKRQSNPAKFGPDTTLYLEVPIKGKFGESILAAGVHESLRYAVRHGIEHVVFTVDATPGDLDEAVAVYRLIDAFKDRIRFHAIVSNCVGDGLAIPLQCDSVYFVGGCKVGGVDRDLNKAKDPMLRGESNDVIRARIADQVTEDLKPRARPLVRAMIDPNAPVAAWRDDDGNVTVGSVVPDGVAPAKIICKSEAHKVLVLEYDQLKTLGAPTLTGGAAKIGEALGIDDWRAESEYGASAMKRAVANVQRREDAAQARFELKVRNNVQRRQTADDEFKDSLAKAAKYDPQAYEYEKLPGTWHRDLGGRRGRRDRGYGSTTIYDNTRTLTLDSQRAWTERSDIAIAYLERAAKAARVMQRLDADAAKIGLKPTYKPDDLIKIMKEMDERYRWLKANRKRITEDLKKP